MIDWFNHPIPRRAPAGGLCDPLNGKDYRGGEFAPFYVPRPIMPQINEEDYPAFLTSLSSKGIVAERCTVPTGLLHQHQRIDHFDRSAFPPEVIAKPVLISADNYILDGNHRYAAHVILRLDTIEAIRIELPFEEAIAAMFAFPGCYTVDGRINPN